MFINKSVTLLSKISVLKMARTKKSTIQSTPKGKLRCKNQLAAARYARQCLKTAEEQLIAIASDPVSETSSHNLQALRQCECSVVSTWTENTISVQKGIVLQILHHLSSVIAKSPALVLLRELLLTCVKSVL
eukprot:TRINITY_DN1071_c0_g1_i1.p1 TRINITY_DN1071_c0_g1~~TRINITY_DN1071_c0_g1_i1.p1  ORF type:complete len:132 (+),score=10.90 TRINITY_DN1071_c0_g1_i1:97-492(+)